MIRETMHRLGVWLQSAVLSVPVRIKITGIIVLAVLILGFSLNYWVTASLSDWLSYILTDARVEAAMRAGGRSVVLVTILAAAGSLVLASFLTFLLIRPLLDLRDMALQVADGDLHARAPVWSRDEIGEVATAVNKMTDHLVAAQNDLARTNRRLAAINQVMLAAERQAEIHDVLYAILQNIVEVINLQTGWVYLRDPERDTFHLASWYQVPTELEAWLLHQTNDSLCYCQQALLDETSADKVYNHQCQRMAMVGYADLEQQHITIPIKARGQKYGVVNLLCRQGYALTEEDTDLLTAVGTQISEIVANAWLRLKLEEKELARQALLESLVEAQEEERRRLARELHDGAGQMLTSLLVRIKTLEKKAIVPDTQRELEALLDIVSETIEQVRELSHRLRPAALEEFGLAVALRTLVKEMTSQTGITAHCYLDLNGVVLPSGVDVILYRIAQEGLTNILRHARANEITVRLTSDENAVLMTIEDNGRGFSPHRLTADPGARHLGLIDMRERAAIAGGYLDVYSAPNQGTTIQVRVPLLEGVR
ncbi:MAG: HAMP domain-containing protein [Chloroflexi bacterium]|nr:HAMP domain-containing protein [Chloroflexota bacterium]